MENSFKINAYFDEESEEVEELIADYLVKNMSNNIEQKNKL